MVAKNHPVKIKTIEKWSASERMSDRFKVFTVALKKHAVIKKAKFKLGFFKS